MLTDLQMEIYKFKLEMIFFVGVVCMYMRLTVKFADINNPKVLFLTIIFFIPPACIGIKRLPKNARNNTYLYCLRAVKGRS